MNDIVFLQFAIEDIEKARDWYDDKYSGLGKSFLFEVKKTVESIRTLPTGYPVKYGLLLTKLMTSPQTKYSNDS